MKAPRTFARTTSRRLLPLAAGLMLAACELPAPPTAVEVQAAALPGKAAPPAGWTAPASAAAVGDAWVGRFRDGALSAMVREALAYNPDLRAAAARVEIARAALALAGAPLLPAFELDGGADRTLDTSGGTTSTTSGLAMGLSWELDLWGRLRSGQAAAFARARMVEADARAAQNSIAGLVARTWFTVIALNQARALAVEQQQIYARQLQLVQTKVAAGQVDDLDLALARASVSGAEATVAQFDARLQTAVRALETLMGRYPSDTIRPAAAFPRLPGSLDAGVPAAALNRRPDMQAALAAVEAAFYGVEETELALLPSLSLTGKGGRVSSDVLGILGMAPSVLQIGVGLLQPVFEGGALKADIAAASARQQEAVAQYGTAALAAFRDVETTLANDALQRRRVSALRQVIDDYGDAVILARAKYDAGTISLQNLLQIESTLIGAQQEQIAATADLLNNRVELYLALGAAP